MNILKEIREAPRDIRLLWASVFLRLLAYGLTNQVLTLFLNGIRMTEDKIGWFMSLTLIGDVICSYILTWYADSWGRRKVLICGSVMMTLSGLAFAFCENFHILLIFAIFGVISPSSDEVGPFKSIEESMIAHLSPNHKRPEVYAMHALIGTIGSALGAIMSGGFIDLLQYFKLAETDLQCYKYVFLLYSFFALLKVIVMISLSEKTELDSHYKEHLDETTLAQAITNDEMAPLMEESHLHRHSSVERTSVTVTTHGAISSHDDYDNDNNNNTLVSEETQPHESSLSPETVTILMKLLVIFMIDSLGSGFMTSSWMVYYYKKFFKISSFALGALFFCTQFVMASSTIPSTIIARMFGPVRATLLVQIPSGIFSILIPFAQNHLWLSILLLNFHFGTTAMDVPPRQILLTNLINPKDLTRVMGIVNIGKTFARCIGPIFTGILAKDGYLWLCFIISGALVITADMVLACSFLHVDKHIMKQINNRQ
ncbi:similar to Saccharomyces cerevisiae YJR124C Putative protein of unknown function [Maudiozyma saulgeensis]|uniref:Major facilitator superfamily (MFS) profile domain-containing protein n=1 Tax=Maudiozyma saulgeensis TaxID=1789683 RepID=A0A1X7R5P7_9SACH|nr:similar to Saccharomyces cerevisiae YJR124C Putative protein of unknown function [Kazachstania saulgeensis]